MPTKAQRAACQVFLRTAWCGLILVVAGTLLSPTLCGAAAPSDLSPAAAVEAQATPRIYRDRVEPHWFAENTRFWYRVSTARNAYEYVLVDVLKGTRRTAFDQARLAEALQKVGAKEGAPERLPISAVQFSDDGTTVQFACSGQTWRCNLNSYSLEQITKDTSMGQNELEIPRASTRTGEETSLTLVNRTDGEVELFWLDSEGERRSYGKLKAGESREQHTFAGHVWIAVDGNGNVIGGCQAQEGHNTVEIGIGKTKLAEPGRRRRRDASTAATSPDGRWRPLLRDYNLVLTNTQTCSELILTHDGTADDSYSEAVFWSPDSKKVVTLRTRKGDDRKVYLIESSPKDQLQPKLESYDYLKPGDRVPVPKPHLFDVETGKEITIEDELFPNPWSLDQVRWSPDSSRFTFVYNQRGHQLLRIVAVEAATGTPRVVVEERSQTFIDYSGKFFVDYVDAKSGPLPQHEEDAAPAASASSDGKGPEIIWMSERDGWNHLYLCDAENGRVKNQITKGPWVVRRVERVDKEHRQIWFTASGIRPAQDPYYVHYCRVNFDGSDLVILTEGDGTHSAQFSPDRKYLIDTWSRVDLAPVTELRRSEDGRLVCSLESADIGELKESRWRAPERFVAKGRDGETDIYGIIRWPKDFAPEKKYPVIESIYAGPQDSFVPKSFHLSSGKSLTEKGFIVVQIDGMGTANRSKKFHDACWKNIGDSGFPDRILWLKAAAAKYAAMDLNRVGIYGTSAGGQSALRALLAHGDFYKAAVADCGCHDNRMDKIWWNEQWMGWPIGPEYAEQSNVTQAHLLQGKLLLMVGELDRNVDPASTMQVVNALIQADKDFELLVMPGMGHGVLGSPYAQRRMLQFFERNL